MAKKEFKGAFVARSATALLRRRLASLLDSQSWLSYFKILVESFFRTPNEVATAKQLEDLPKFKKRKYVSV